MTGLSHHDVTVLLFSLGVLLAAARVLGELARRLRQPAVIGELLAGVILGPTVLGALWPGGMAALFPQEGPVAVALHGLTTLSITLFLLVAGMEVDLSTIWRRRMAAFSVGLGGMLAPFVVGLVIAAGFPTLMGAPPEVPRTVFALFLATALSISALPVIAKMLLDLQLFRTELGMTIIAAAVFNDLCGWLIFALVLAMMGLSTGAGLDVWQTVLLTLGFTAFMFTMGRWLIDRSLPWVQAHTTWPGGVLGFSLVLGVFCAAFTEWIGVHAIFGAFILGVALGDSRHLRANTRSTIDHFVSFIFAPLFFASVGLRVDFAAHFDLGLTLLILFLATAGKLAGAVIAAKQNRFTWPESWAIGWGLNARGAMEIILGLLALEVGVINERLFVALVVMALVTSMTSGTLMQWVLGRPRAVRFVDFASGRTFAPRLRAASRREAVEELAQVVADAQGGAGGLDREKVLGAAWSRETLISSAIGNAVAVPHARLPGLTQPLVAVGVSRMGLDWDAPDGAPVRLVILMVTPAQDPKIQLDLLASIAKMLHDRRVVDRLVDSANWTEFLAAVNAESPPAPDHAPAPGGIL